jgi:hypothetical protein
MSCVRRDGEYAASIGNRRRTAHADAAVPFAKRTDREPVMRMTRKTVIVFLEPEEVENTDRKLDARYRDAHDSNVDTRVV